MASNKIVKAFIRHYTDNNQTTAYVEWDDGARTEGKPDNTHMRALLMRAEREGLQIERETW